MENKIKSIMSTVFEIEENLINEDSSPDTMENWDSLRHMNLVVALEEEFDIEFDDEEIAEMMDYKGIMGIISSKIK